MTHREQVGEALCDMIEGNGTVVYLASVQSRLGLTRAQILRVAADVQHYRRGWRFVWLPSERVWVLLLAHWRPQVDA